MNRLFIYLLSGFLASIAFYVFIQGLPDHLELLDPKTSLEQAQQFYQAGETAKTVFDRKEAFNKSLALYLELEKKYHPDHGNGKLPYNIANTYYQLDETPLSIFYYYRALYLSPRDIAIQHNLATALQKMNLTQEAPTLISGSTLTLARFLSLPQRLCLFFWLMVSLFIFASLFIWRPHFLLKIPITLLSLAAFSLLITLLYTRFISPQEAVLIKSSTLYRDAGTQYAKVTEDPAPAGLKVEVISIREDGSWIKILTPQGTLGYVANDGIKLM